MLHCSALCTFLEMHIILASNTVKVEIFAHFVAKRSGAKINRTNILSKCVFAYASMLSAKLNIRDMHLSRLGAKISTFTVAYWLYKMDGIVYIENEADI